MNRQETEGSFLRRRTTIRFRQETSAIRRVARAGLMLGVITAGLALAWEEAGRPNVFENSVDTVSNRIEAGMAEFSVCHDLCNTPVEGKPLAVFKTDTYDVFDFAPVRNSPILGDDNIIGFARPGQEVVTEAWYGVTYPSSGESSHGAGEVTGPDGNVYGEWRKVHMLEVEILNSEGVWETKFLSNVFMSENFLTKDGVGELELVTES